MELWLELTFPLLSWLLVQNRWSTDETKTELKGGLSLECWLNKRLVRGSCCTCSPEVNPLGLTDVPASWNHMTNLCKSQLSPVCWPLPLPHNMVSITNVVQTYSVVQSMKCMWKGKQRANSDCKGIPKVTLIKRNVLAQHWDIPFSFILKAHFLKCLQFGNCIYCTNSLNWYTVTWLVAFWAICFWFDLIYLIFVFKW